jgi:hypothetical protein
MPKQQAAKPKRRRLPHHQHHHCRVCGGGGQLPTALRPAKENDLLLIFRDGKAILACRICRAREQS